MNEGKYTLDSTKIEAKKIYCEIDDKNYGKHAFELLGFQNEKSEEEIIEWLMTRFE